MSHFTDHKMSIKDQRALLRRVKVQVTDARTKFVRANTAMKGMFHETEDEVVKEQITRVMATLCLAIDAIDGKIVPEDS